MLPVANHAKALYWCHEPRVKFPFLKIMLIDPPYILIWSAFGRFFEMKRFQFIKSYYHIFLSHSPFILYIENNNQ